MSAGRTSIDRSLNSSPLLNNGVYGILQYGGLHANIDNNMDYNLWILKRRLNEKDTLVSGEDCRSESKSQVRMRLLLGEKNEFGTHSA